MSEYIKAKSKIRNLKSLLEALKELGFDNVEVGKDLHLYGYRGDIRPETANVVIRRKYCGDSANDVGFKLEADGTYTSIISQYDRNDNLKIGPKFEGKVVQLSIANNTERMAKLRGLRVRRRMNEKGEIKMFLSRI